MGKKSTPPAPDYAGAAQKQADSSREVTEQQSWANRPNQVTPFGNQSWANTPTWDPSTQQYINRWTQTTTLPSDLNDAANAEMGATRNRAILGQDVSARLNNDFAQPMDWTRTVDGGIMPQMGQAVRAPEYGDLPGFRKRMEDNLYQRATSRLDPQWQQREDQQRNRLYGMGLSEGDSAFAQQMANFGRDRNDAYTQANFGAIAGGGTEMANQLNMGGQMQGQQLASSGYQNTLRQQALSEALQKRGQNLNEQNALMSGQQVGMPNMPNFSQAGVAQGNQALSAAQMQGQHDLDAFNAKQQAIQGMMSGISGIAGSFMPGM